MSDTQVLEIPAEVTEEPTTENTQRRTPWDRMNALHDDTTYENVGEVLKDAGLDFTVSKREIQFKKSDGTWHTSPDRMYVVCDDNDEELDVVSKDYGVFQYSEAFEFLNHIPGRRFVASSLLKGRKQAFMVVQLPDLEDFTLFGDDRVELDVVIRTSHDRSRAVEAFVMPMRIFCTNQLPIRAMTPGIQNRWAVNHIGNVADKMHDAEVLVKRTRAYVEDFKVTAERLNRTLLSDDEARATLKRTLRDTPTRDEVADHIVSLWKNAPTVGHTETAWGFVNAVSDHFEHGRRGGTAQSRLLGALEGQTRGILDKVVPFVLSRYSHN